MNTRFVIRVAMVSIGVTITAPIPTAAQIPETVAPGATQRVAVIEGRCPTFIWAAVRGALEHEVVAYRMSDQSNDVWRVDLADAPMVAYARVPGGATAWQPELSDCLEPDGRYVWFVRGILDRGGDIVTEWSSGRFFTIAPIPSLAEVENAIRVLRRYYGSEAVPDDVAAGGRGTSGTQHRPDGDLGGSPSRAPTDVKSVGSATAAVKAAPAGLSGEVYGVIGLTGSADGAGLGAANTAGGADLVLDGASDGVADARLSESGVDRPSVSPQVYDVRNSLGGGMTLRIDGNDVVTTLTDQDTPPRDAGNQLDLVGNTLDVLEGSGSGLDADTLDGIDAVEFAATGHDHFGEQWSGQESGGGLSVVNTLVPVVGPAIGISGHAAADTSVAWGVYGQSDSDSGRGVYGKASAATGNTIGVFGVSSSSDGAGVYGRADANTGTTHGVYGSSDSPNGYGVYGITNSTAGAGVAAVGYGGGVDLLLDGIRDLSVDTLVRHSGIDRPVAAAVTFNIENSSPGGTMTLQVDGVPVVTTATDKDTLADLSCSPGDVPVWDGSVWACGTN